ncbi:MAG: hypothetical protein HDR19_07610 [Lachnospiraceae bacterium]|nr:hypothetical protein [Lachnospiraceae bacterium]
MFRRVLSILLCGCLLAGSLPVTGVAAEEQAIETTQVTAENAGRDDNNTSTQLENDADAFDTAENVDSVDRENGQNAEIAGTVTEEKIKENQTVTETKTAEPEDKTKIDENADVSEEVDETEETQTQALAEEADAGETAVNKDEADDITPEITLSPLSLGGKLNIRLTGVSETAGSYRAIAYVKTEENSWRQLDSDSYMELTSENNYEGEWLIYSDSYIGAGSSYDIRIDIQKDYSVISSESLTLNTSKISLNLEVKEIAGKSAIITCGFEESDEFLEWHGHAYGKVYYRVKGSDSEWKENSSIYLYPYSENPTELRNLALDTEYEMKVTANNDENVIYGTTEFKTTEGTTQGMFRDLNVRFSGFAVSVYGYYTPSDYADTTEVYLVEKDNTGALLAQSKLDYSSKYISENVTLRMETAKVQLKAVETLEDMDSEENPVKKEYLSDEYTRGSVPNVTFGISNTSAGVSTFHADLTYTGDMCLGSSSQTIYAALYYGKPGEDLETNPKTTSVSYSKDGSKTQTLTFSGLTENTAYHGKIVVYVGSPIIVYEQEIELDNFTTKENKTYLLDTTFPDARLRELIRSRASLGSSATEVTAVQLEKITYLSAQRSDFDTAVITDLTGIELLTELTSLYVQNNEISDTPAIDWSKLTGLKSLNLTGNELTKIPDLSKNTSLTSVNLNENLIPAEEFEAVSAKLPEGVRLSSDVQSSQRLGGLTVISEDTYYQIAGKSPLLIKVKGYKTGLPYTFRYTVDGNAITFSNQTWGSDGYIQYKTNTGLELGSHTLTVEMYQKGNKISDKSVAFQMAEGGAYLEKDLYRFNAQENYYNIDVYSNKEVSAAYMQNGDSVIAVDMDIDSWASSYEYRYKTLSNSGIYLDGLNIYQSYLDLRCIRNKNPEAGTYDLKVVYDDNTEETLQGVIEIIDKAFVKGGSIGYRYDSTGSFFYLSIEGYGFDATKLEYAFTYGGKQQAAEYVNAKETSSGYIIKFKKADTWTPKEGDSVQVKLTPKGGYDVILDKDTFTVSISQGIYYCAYNKASNKLEVGITSNLKRENVTFKLARYNSWDDAYQQNNVIETIDVNPEIVTETISYLVPMKDGEVYRLPSGCYYRLDMISGGYNDNETFEIYGESTNYWSSSKYVGEGTGEKSFYYYSEIPFGDESSEKDFQAEITGEKLTTVLRAKKVWTYSYHSDSLTTVGMTFDMSSLTQGSYAITLYYKDEKLSSYNITVLPTDKFVITSDYHPYAYWIDDSSFRVYFNTINIATSDEFTVSLTDIFGNPVSGLKTEILNRYTDSVYVKVTGLKKSDAYRYYYIKVTHNTFGEAYKPDRTTKYFTDERGKYEEISDSKFTWTSTNNRMSGIGMYNDIVFPVTVKVYKPYETELVTSFTITKGDLESGTSNPAWYYFKQTLIDELPDKDALYDVAVIDSNGQTDLWTENPIGLRQSSTTSTWTVSPTQLSLNLDNDEAKTGTITVKGNAGTPTFKSDNAKVATVAADKADKNKAVVTAVGEGTTTISITADKTTKTVAVTVTKEPIKPTGISITAPESAAVGDKVAISASVTPVGAWTQQDSITWTSSDSSVISIPAGSTGLEVEADALKAGSATITAVLDGTEFTASCEITVVKKISDEEQDEIAKEIGVLCFLEGADTTLADIALPDGWSWEDPTQKPTVDNSHPVQDFAAVYSKDDVSFERYLDVYVSKLDSVRITGKSTVNSQKEALYTCAYTYVGADFDSGYEVNWQWTLGQNLAAETNTGERIAVKVSGNDTLSVTMTVTNPTTGKAVSQDALLQITAGEIPDSEPELENKKITIYKNSTQHVPIGLVAKDGNSVTAVTVADNTDFKFERDEDGEWLIGLTDSGKGKYAKKTTETLTLKVETESGKECEKTLGVTVDVTEITTKNVKFKQTVKPNAAYSDTDTVTAEFSVSSKYIIEDITAVQGSTAEKFAVKSYNEASGILVLEAKTNVLDKDAKTYPAKVEVKVRDYGTWTLDLNVAVQNKKPSLKLGDTVILSGVNADASVALYNGKTELSCTDYTVTKAEGEGVTVTKEGSKLKVAYTGEKNGNYKVTVRKNTWASDADMELKGKISVLDPAKAKLGADLAKVTINISEGYSAPVTISAGIKGSGVSVDLTAKPAKDKDAQAVTAEVLGSGKIRITPKDGAAKGSYKIAIDGSVGGTAVKGMTVSVTLTDKAPEAKLAAKGKINLANREGTSITYTPSLKNLPETLSIKNVRMDKTAEDSGFFNVKMTNDGKVVMTAVTGKTMDPKTKYKPVLIFTLSNGKTLKTDGKFTVSVTNKLPKITVTTLSSALCTSNAGHRASYQVNAGNGYTISNVTTDDTNYKVTFNGRTNTIAVSLADNASVAAGNKYTVPCTVCIKGADNTTKPLTVKLKVIVY